MLKGLSLLTICRRVKQSQGNVARKKPFSSRQLTGSHYRSFNGKSALIKVRTFPLLPYSPGLTLSELFLFLNLKIWLGGKRFSASLKCQLYYCGTYDTSSEIGRESANSSAQGVERKWRLIVQRTHACRAML